MKCDRCNGQGFSVIAKWKCPVCDGKGVVEPLTEQEWLQTASTEQLVSFLLWYPNNVHGYPKPKMSIAEEEDAIREWLKQPHQKE